MRTIVAATRYSTFTYAMPWHVRVHHVHMHMFIAGLLEECVPGRGIH